MHEISRFDRRVDVAWLLVVGIASSVWCLTAATQLSATFDEPFYLKSGLFGWRTGSIKPLMSAGTMPLPIDVQTLPVYVWERFRGQPFDSVLDVPEFLGITRAANLVFWWLLLWYTLKLGRKFGGSWAGRFACGLVAADPNLLAHAALATTDISITATTLLAIYHFHEGLGRSWRYRVFFPGLCYGLAVLTKASAIAFVPLGFLVMGLYRHWTTEPRGSLRALAKDLFQIAMIGTVLVFGYCGSDYTTEHTFVSWAKGLPDGPLKAWMLPISENLKIFTNAGEGLASQIKHNFRGHGVYLHGDWHQRATWYYFPYALSVKLPLATLALIVAGLIRYRAWFGNPLGWFALVLFLFSFNCRVQIGIRLVFPLVAMLYLAAAVAIVRDPRRPAEGWPWFAVAVLAANVAVAAACWPHGLRFTNQLHGGSEEGYKSLGDSNYDWGQGLVELAKQVSPGDPPLAVWYYGTDPAIYRSPFRHMPLHTMQIQNAEQVRQLVGNSRLAVSITLLNSNPNIPGTANFLPFLKAQTPVVRTATFFIFDLSK